MHYKDTFIVLINNKYLNIAFKIPLQKLLTQYKKIIYLKNIYYY